MNEITTAIAAAITPYLPGLIDSIADRVIERMEQKKSDKQKRFYTRQQSAEVLNVSLATIDRMARNGDITPLRLPNTRGVRYDADELESKAQSRKRKTYQFKGK